MPTYGGAAAAPHAVSSGGEGGAAGAVGGEGRGQGRRGVGAAGRAALTSFVASRLAPLAMRCSRQPSSPLSAVNERAVSPSYEGAAAAPHEVSGGGEGGATGGEDGW